MMFLEQMFLAQYFAGDKKYSVNTRININFLIFFFSTGSYFRSSNVPPWIQQSLLPILLRRRRRLRHGAVQCGMELHAGNNGRSPFSLLSNPVEFPVD